MTIQNGQIADADEVNARLPPIGSVIAWLKSFTNTPSLPAGFVECNGQVLTDADSVYNGQTIPDLNGSSGEKRFLRGSTTSGSTGGNDDVPVSAIVYQGGAASAFPVNTASSDNNLPFYYEVVWIMRIK